MPAPPWMMSLPASPSKLSLPSAAAQRVGGFGADQEQPSRALPELAAETIAPIQPHQRGDIIGRELIVRGTDPVVRHQGVVGVVAVVGQGDAAFERVLQPQRVAEFVQQRLVADAAGRGVCVFADPLHVVEVDPRIGAVADHRVAAVAVAVVPAAQSGDAVADEVGRAEVQVRRATAGGGSEHDAGQIADVVERRQHGRLLGGVEGADVAADLAADVGIAGAGGEAVVDDVALRCQPVPAGAVVEQGVDVVEPALGLGGDLGNGGHVGARNSRMRGMLRIPRGRGCTDVTRCARRAAPRSWSSSRLRSSISKAGRTLKCSVLEVLAALAQQLAHVLATVRFGEVERLRSHRACGL
jgi:hypothetical protein